MTGCCGIHDYTFWLFALPISSAWLRHDATHQDHARIFLMHAHTACAADERILGLPTQGLKPCTAVQYSEAPVP